LHSLILSNNFQKTLFYYFPHRPIVSSLKYIWFYYFRVFVYPNAKQCFSKRHYSLIFFIGLSYHHLKYIWFYYFQVFTYPIYLGKRICLEKYAQNKHLNTWDTVKFIPIERAFFQVSTTTLSIKTLYAPRAYLTTLALRAVGECPLQNIIYVWKSTTLNQMVFSKFWLDVFREMVGVVGVLVAFQFLSNMQKGTSHSNFQSNEPFSKFLRQLLRYAVPWSKTNNQKNK
jgi:hypothetical protein